MKTLICNIVCAFAMVALIAACSTTGSVTSTTSKRETLLANAGFKQLTVTTPKQKAQVAKLDTDRVSAVKYQGKLYYVFPTGAKDHIYVGKQKQFNAYKASLKAQAPAAPTTASTQTASQQAAEQANGPSFEYETAGPNHIKVEEFDGFPPINNMFD
jgi:hypothetical protein